MLITTIVVACVVCCVLATWYAVRVGSRRCATSLLVEAQRRHLRIAWLMQRHVRYLSARRALDHEVWCQALSVLAWGIDIPTDAVRERRDEVVTMVRTAMPSATDDEIAVGAVFALAVMLSVAVCEQPPVSNERVH